MIDDELIDNESANKYSYKKLCLTSRWFIQDMTNFKPKLHFATLYRDYNIDEDLLVLNDELILDGYLSNTEYDLYFNMIDKLIDNACSNDDNTCSDNFFFTYYMHYNIDSTITNIKSQITDGFELEF